jgi:hypothetical protein
MRKVREVLRLRHALGLSYREIGEATGVGKTAVGEYIRRAEVIGITWPVADAFDDAALEQRMFAPPGAVAVVERGHVDACYITVELFSPTFSQTTTVRAPATGARSRSRYGGPVPGLLRLAHPDRAAELSNFQRLAKRGAGRGDLFLEKLGMRGHQDDRHTRCFVLDHPRQRQAVRFARRHLDISDDHIDRVAIESFKGSHGTQRHNGAHPHTFEGTRCRICERDIIIHE